MSYDLQLAVARKPDPAQLAAWARLEGGVRVVAAGSADAASPPDGGWSLERRRRLAWRQVALLDPPIRVGAGDLNETLRSGLREPRWLVELHLAPGEGAGDVATAGRLAAYLASECDGAVFDPQLDRLVWPAEPVRPVRTQREQRIRLLTLEWYVPPTRFPPDMPIPLLRLLGEACSEAVPRRFGTFEPPQGRLVPDDADGRFAEAWRHEAAIPYGGHLFWTTTRPVLGGSAFFPDRRDDFKPSVARRAVTLRLTLNGSHVGDDAAWLERCVALFELLAARFEAVYADGYVERNVVLRRGVWYDRDSEVYPKVTGPWFVGLPGEPMWLGWFGPEYAGLVAPSVPPDHARWIGPNLLVRRGRTPSDRSELRDVGRWPADLVASPVEGVQTAARVLPEFE